MESQTVQQVKIEKEMRDAYLDYAMSVIVSRALPDARDGLKPVHRRILYAMHDMGLRADTSHKKSARIVGEVLGKYHPHGDGAVYDAMVRLAQDFSMRYMLVNGQGNYGSIDGDGAAAMRYTEARMANIGQELLIDIAKETVDFVENFDGSLVEPAVLPSNIPNLLVNGASGIAVGMSTNIPPHNLREVVDALKYMLNNWDNLDDVTVSDLMEFIKGPDFPTGGLVYHHKDGAGDDTLLAAYATGRGKITVRAKAHIEDMGRGKSRIIITELPYQTNKTSLIERIATLVRDERLTGVADLRDESDRQGLRIAIELQRGADPSDVLAGLFKLTPLQDTFSIIMLALVNNEPRVLTLKQALRVYLDHRQEIIKRRSQYDLEKARARAHILEGLLEALDQLDEVIATIRKSRSVDTARNNLMKLLKIDEIQAQAILDMQLRRLASLERRKIQDEFIEKKHLIKYLENLLATPVKMREVIAEELTEIREKYGDQRRTVIVDDTASSATVEDLMIPEESTWVTMTTTGKIARMLDDAPPKVTTSTKEPPQFILETTTGQVLYLFTDDGECATIPVQVLGSAQDPADGSPFNTLCSLPENKRVVAVLALPGGAENGYLFLATEEGQVKRLRISDLPGMSSSSFTVMNVGNGDRLGWVMPTDGKQEILLTSSAAQAIRFKEDDVRPTGLPAGGMRGIKLPNSRTRVVGANIALENKYVWTISDDGVAKISPMEDYPTQGRAGGGVIAMRLPSSSKELVAAIIGGKDDNIIVLSNKDKPLYMRLGRAPEVKRGRDGGDIVISMTRKNEAVTSVVGYQTPFIEPEPEETPDEQDADDESSDD